MGPLAIAGIGAGANLLGGLFQGNQQKKDRQESARQFDLGYGLQKGQQDFDQALAKRQQGQENALAPGRQQILQALYQRMGIAAPAVDRGAAVAAAPPPSALPPAHRSLGEQINPSLLGGRAQDALAQSDARYNERNGIGAPAVQSAPPQAMSGVAGFGPQAPGFGSSLDAGSEDRIRALMQALGVGGGR